MAGISALASGIGVVLVARRRHRSGAAGERVRALIGVAFIMWGVGQLLLAAQIAATGERAFGPGDVLSALAGPVGVVALLTLPRRSRFSRPGLLISLDALMLASLTTLVLWWSHLGPLTADTHAPASTAVPGVTATFVDVLIVAYALLMWGREKRAGLLVLSGGCALQAIADVMSLADVIAREPVPWQSGAIWCVAWPLMGLGVARLWTEGLTPDPDGVSEELGQSRMTTITTVITVLVLALAVEIQGVPHPSGTSTVLFWVVVTLLVLRELLANRVRARLVRRLGTEALRDALTGLPNRRGLVSHLRLLEEDRPFVLLTVGLDGFKEVNGLFGHQAGDGLLVGAAELLLEQTPPDGVVARIGGDEFGVLVPGDVVDGQRLAARLAAVIRTSSRTRRDGLSLSASIGVGRVAPEAGAPEAADLTPEERPDRLVALVESATALRAAKALGRDRIAVYPGAVEQACQRRFVVERRLREALDQGLLVMHAQPLVDLRTGLVRGFESLARWTDDLLGPVSPAEFVPVAEQTGLVTALGDFALRSTLESACALGLGGRDVEVAVNVSPLQLRLPGFAARVIDLVEETGLSVRQLTLEITEAILVSEDDSASDALAELADAGIRLAIDDFGTGYSALGYLRRLPIDVLKIDRSWVVDTVTDARTRSVVSGVIDLAHQLNTTVVMEGIEDAATAEVCRALGADRGQGWLFGRPAPWTEAVRTLPDLGGARAPAVHE
ncbi:MAG: bifunctional diguanylate cyclase/phosphodiesterase [Actinomycetota bacterium]|nr:bifunctional diguanylate cyclase/phosphodiesterase [Actinomycetota bacterium]